MKDQVKTFTQMVLAAVLGGVMTFGLISWKGAGLHEVKRSDPKGISFARTASYSNSGAAFPDFSAVASTVKNSVVHIRSIATREAVSRTVPQFNLPDPFKDFFGDDQFDRFFHFQPQQRGPQTRIGSGSGVIVSESGYIVTNNHVIAEADEIEVTLPDNRKLKAEVVGTDPSTDLALLKVDAENLLAAVFANSDDLQIGQWVLAVGNPFNLESTVTAGIVSAKARNINILKDKAAIESFIQTDAAVNPGNSGGALVDVQGNLVGINTAIASPTGAYAGYSFAVPSNIVGKVVKDLMDYGEVQRGFLGIMIRDMNSTLADQEGLEITEGVYVDSLMESSPAGAAGVRQGDVILEVAGIAVHTSPELQEIVGRHRPGDEVELVVHRKGKEKRISVTLKNREGSTGIVRKSKDEVIDALGAEFETVGKKEARELDIDGGVKVVKLSAGKLRRFTGIREGFIITAVDGKPVKTVEDLKAALEDKSGGVMLEGRYPDRPGTAYYAFGL